MYTLNTNFCILTIQFVGLEAGKQAHWVWWVTQLA